MHHEQRIISVFRTSCEPILTHNDFRERRRTIKDLFVKREYLTIFTDPALTAVYVAEYSPSRALCYHELFSSNKTLSDALSTAELVFCVGAGSGGELVGLRAALDKIDYSEALIPVQLALQNEFSNNIKEIVYESSVFDILSAEPSDVMNKTRLVQTADIITAFFILNELLANSKKDFVQFVKLLVSTMKQGALLVVVDSAGSFSEVNVGKKETKNSSMSSTADSPPPTYMVYNLLDAIQAFDIVDKSDSQWYRYPEGLHYPIKLNNMRHFLRVYKKK